jgi:hypothetical protein
MVCLRNISVDTLHKGDTEDNNNNNNNKFLDTDRKGIKKEADNILKYKDFKTEIRRM